MNAGQNDFRLLNFEPSNIAKHCDAIGMFGNFLELLIFLISEANLLIFNSSNTEKVLLQKHKNAEGIEPLNFQIPTQSIASLQTSIFESFVPFDTIKLYSRGAPRPSVKPLNFEPQNGVANQTPEALKRASALNLHINFLLLISQKHLQVASTSAAELCASSNSVPKSFLCSSCNFGHL